MLTFKPVILPVFAKDQEGNTEWVFVLIKMESSIMCAMKIHGLLSGLLRCKMYIYEYFIFFYIYQLIMYLFIFTIQLIIHCFLNKIPTFS